MPQIHVEYFAILREHAGKSSEDLDTQAATAAVLFAELEARYSFPAMGRMKVAINDEFSEWDAVLADGDAIVFIPPVAGG
jgi:molybdopterin converting factor subunit 1